MNIMIFTDNEVLYNAFSNIVKEKSLDKQHKFVYACSPSNELFYKYPEVQKINVSSSGDDLIEQFNLIISCHSKQIFPKKVVNSIRCINIHPGFNPYNRGWFPQVFSIINNKPLGATIHEMDEFIDHGNIIIQKGIELFSWDTSLTAYNRVIAIEIKLLNEYINILIEGTYQSIPMVKEGNYNSKQDYDKLCKIDLDKMASYKDTINHLRALSHGELNNAYFLDEDNNKIYIKINLYKEGKNES